MKANKTRFCPSPTGLLHLGNLRTALFSSLLAKKHGGSFLLRIEDTDLERSKKEFSEAICEDLEWMGLDWDEGPKIEGKEDSYYQSDRMNLYESFYRYTFSNFSKFLVWIIWNISCYFFLHN